MQETASAGSQILVLTNCYMPHSGGARVYYYNLYRRMVERFSDRLLILTKKVTGWEEFDQRESSPRLRIIRHGHPLPNWKIKQLPRIISPLSHALGHVAKIRPDVIHFGDLFPPGLISLALHKTIGIPYLAYCHGDENAQVDQRKYQPIVRDRIYRHAAAVVAANEFARQGLLRIGVQENRIHKITPGVDLDHLCPGDPDQQLIRDLKLQGKTVLLTAARLFEKKGHRAVLRAIARIHSELPHLHYLIAGDGLERPRLEALVRELNIVDAVTFLGDISHDRLVEYYRLADVFVMANRRSSYGDIESFGMVFVEANAVGKPVIAGRSGGVAESVIDGTTGLIIDPDDIEELASAIRLLVTNQALRDRLGSAGLRRAQTDFDWVSRADYLHRITSEIASAHRTSRA